MSLVLLLAALQDPVIVPDPGKDWKADLERVQAVLDAGARELWAHAKNDRPPKILVAPKGGPIVLFNRGPAGEFLVRLNLEEDYWSQYVYQFSHEFTHILCGAEEMKHRHGWFEESLCEVGSLYTLRRGAETWKTRPPYKNAGDYARHLADYASKRIAAATLPEGTSFTDWYAAHREALEAKADDRPRNCIVASQLLPLLEAEPERWESLRWLHAPTGPDASFAGHLAAWRQAAPERHRPFIDRVAAVFGLTAR